MWFLSLLVGMLCTIYPVSGVLDRKCVDNCTCCVDRLCHETVFFNNTCTKGCIDGHRGARCYELCQYPNCKICGDKKSHSTVCTECFDGFYLGPNKDCASPCPSNCKSCSSSTMCTECKKGFYDKDGSTTCPYAHCPAHCECTIVQDDCVACKKGYFDTTTSCIKHCPDRCQTCESEESCNECKNGFYNGYEHDIKTNPQQNSCAFACRESCTQCQSYDNCLQCVNGNYGITCQKECSVGCKDKTCSIDLGKCECIISFTGDTCIECVNGKYGLLCNQTCPKHCKERICDRSSGDCIHGCIYKNITGDTCNKCAEGRYGELCNMLCPQNCRNNECARYSGHCSNGCAGNFNGTKCDQCVRNKYGSNCELGCPVNCAENICERKSGTCYACIGHFQGKLCDACTSGYRGPNCDKQCSQYCFNLTCGRETGECIYGCINDYSGDRCCVRSDHCVECYSNIECRKCESGFFRHLCSESCPKDCLGSCDISSGECDNISTREFGDEAEKPFVTAILGTFIAVLVVIIVVQNVFNVIRKKRETAQREVGMQASDVTYENHQKYEAPHFSENNESNTVSGSKANVYEAINRAYDADHDYQQISTM